MNRSGSGLPDLAPDILDATTCLLIVTEFGTGVVVGMNSAAEALAGVERDAAIGLPLWEIASPAHRPMLRRALQDPVGQGMPESFESTVNLESGAPRRVVWVSSFISDADDVPTHMVMTGTDISSDAATGGLFAHLMEAASATALISTDRAGRVTYCSAGAERLLGLDGTRLVGEPMPRGVFDESELRARAHRLGRPEDLGLLGSDDVAERAPGSSGEQLDESDWTLRRSDGTRLIASVVVSSARDPRGLHVGYVGVAHDVTERREAQRVLEEALMAGEQAVVRLHELDRAKSEFVATVNHELRTPITSIVASAEILQDGLPGELNPAQRELVDMVARKGRRMVALVNDLRVLGRADTGGLQMTMEDLDLRSVVRSARASLQALLLDRSLEVEVTMPEHPTLVHGDATYLTRTVLNLLSNAVKFTDDAGSISCRLFERGGSAVLEVSDSGVGIPSSEQAEVFTRFFRSSTAQARETPGPGLGLSVAETIVRQHGGTIALDSDHMQGSTFTVTIPLATEQPAAGSAA